MENSGGFKGKVKSLWDRQKTARPEPEVFPSEEELPRNKFVQVLRVITLVIYRLRKVFMAIPVAFAAMRLAAYNTDHLPLLVGLDLQTTGEFARTISRQSAVTFPLVITGGCLVLMFFSRKSFYPWLISVFSLVVPVLLLITNIYPA